MKFSLKNNNLKLLNYKKYYYIAVAGILSLALLMGALFAAFGLGFFNAGFSYSGGYTVTIKFGNELTDDTRKDLTNDVKSYIEGFKQGNQHLGLRVRSVEYLGKNNSASIKVNFSGTGDSEEMIEVGKDLKEGLKKEFFPLVNPMAGQVSDVLRVDSLITQYVFMRSMLAFTLLVVLLFAFYAIRFGLFEAWLASVGVIFDGILFMAVLTILRLPLDVTFAASLLLTIFSSVINTLFLFDKLRALAKNKQAPEVDANLAGSQLLFRQAITTGFLVAILLLTTIVALFMQSTGLILFGIISILGLAVTSFTSLCLMPSVWAMLKTALQNRPRRSAKKNKKA